MVKKKKADKKRFSHKALFKTRKRISLVSLLLFLVLFLSSHELGMRYFPDIACVVCHEMKEPVRKSRESGVVKNHPNCADCHFDAGIARIWHTNITAVMFLVEHFRRDSDGPLKPPPEPVFLDLNQEPGYFSLVPNHRCYQCKDAKNHKQIEQQMVHRKLIKDISQKPCKDCHNHEMRNGQKFYEKVLPLQAK